jgi:hypothetical protein
VVSTSIEAPVTETPTLAEMIASFDPTRLGAEVMVVSQMNILLNVVLA